MELMYWYEAFKIFNYPRLEKKNKENGFMQILSFAIFGPLILSPKYLSTSSNMNLFPSLPGRPTYTSLTPN